MIRIEFEVTEESALATITTQLREMERRYQIDELSITKTVPPGRPRKVTEQMEKVILAMQQAGKSANFIAGAVGVTAPTVASFLRRHHGGAK
jgi:hypothetical protein